MMIAVVRPWILWGMSGGWVRCTHCSDYKAQGASLITKLGEQVAITKLGEQVAGNTKLEW